MFKLTSLRPILRRMLEDQNYDDPLQKTQQDRKILNQEGESRNNHRCAVVVQDLATQMHSVLPVPNKNFSGDGKKFTAEKPKVTYTDNSLEVGKSFEESSWNHRTSTPRRTETNGIVERAVRRVTEGTSTVLFQSGFDEQWWADSMECCCYLRNVQDLLTDGKTLDERRFEESFLEQCTNIIRCQPEIKQDFDNLVRKSYQVSFKDKH